MDAGWDILTQVFRLEGFVKKCLYNGFLTRSKARNVDPCRSSRDKSGVLFCCPQLVCASLLFRIWLIAIINKVATWLIALIHLVVSLFFSLMVHLVASLSALSTKQMVASSVFLKGLY